MRTENEIMRDAKALYDFLSEARPAPEKADIILTAGSHDVKMWIRDRGKIETVTIVLRKR